MKVNSLSSAMTGRSRLHRLYSIRSIAELGVAMSQPTFFPPPPGQTLRSGRSPGSRRRQCGTWRLASPLPYQHAHAASTTLMFIPSRLDTIHHAACLILEVCYYTLLCCLTQLPCMVATRHQHHVSCLPANAYWTYERSPL